jgi:hypothetical protein
MINLTHSAKAGPDLHKVAAEPAPQWVLDKHWVIDAAPDDAGDLDPIAQWPAPAERSGVCGAVSPRVVALPGGGYRLYYTQLLARSGFPSGAVDYDQSTSRILSAFSTDGSAWTLEPGVRLSAAAGGAGDFRVVSSEVVPIDAQAGAWRMYYECCRGPQTTGNEILSARSADGGLTWTREPGVRWGNGDGNFSAPRIQFLAGQKMRLLMNERGKGIISALSNDGGLTFTAEPGLRIAQDGPADSHAAFAPEIVQVGADQFVMYYAGYAPANRARILRATSSDGLNWHKDSAPVISPEAGTWAGVKCSEMALVVLPASTGAAPRFRMLFEACDGTADGERGVWRIASATNQ